MVRIRCDGKGFAAAVGDTHRARGGNGSARTRFRLNNMGGTSSSAAGRDPLGGECQIGVYGQFSARLISVCTVVPSAKGIAAPCGRRLDCNSCTGLYFLLIVCHIPGRTTATQIIGHGIGGLIVRRSISIAVNRPYCVECHIRRSDPIRCSGNQEFFHILLFRLRRERGI